MELGKLAKFAGEDGNPKQVTIDDRHISALLSHAGNRSIPSHWTHDYFNADTDPLHARIGALKELRKDDAGNLVADLHLSPGDHRETALWNAANHPEGMMLSAVFSYGKSDPDCLPLDFQAADLVAQGAATTALLSEDTQTTKSMDITELLAALQDPAVKEALKAVIKSVEKTADDADAAAAESNAAAMEDAGGVTDADKDPADSTQPALMRAALRLTRAGKRQREEVAALAKTISEDETALLAKAKVQAEAAFAGKIGTTHVLKTIGADTESENATAKFGAAIQKFRDAGMNEAKATLAAMDAHPDLYEASQQTIFRARQAA